MSNNNNDNFGLDDIHTHTVRVVPNAYRLDAGGAGVCCIQPSTFSGQSQTFSFGLNTRLDGHGMWCFLSPSHM